MDILKAEIARKRKQLESDNLSRPNSDKKYFKRGDLVAKEEERYWRRHGYLNDDESGKANKEQEMEDSLEDPSTSKKQKILPRKEVIKRFRQRTEPIRLFGEDDNDSYQRLKKLEILEPEVADRGMRNEFQEAMDKLEQEYLNEVVKYKGEDSDKKLNPNDVHVKESDSTSYEEIHELAVEKLDKGNVAQDQDIILKLLKFLLQQWGKALNARDDAEKASAKGKFRAAQFRQTGEYIKPLVGMLKKKNTPTDILESLVKIVQKMLQRNYIKANDSYMEMAIGNAAWPVGVTNPGIHARPGREKIFSKQVAHVLNDETQRKYIQGLKRIMTQCQLMFPSDPSRCVNYSFERM